MNPSRANGFTLVELMIVMAIVAILVAIAIPQFQRQVALAKRVEAFSALRLVFHAEFSHFVAQDTYVWVYEELGLETYIKNELKYYRIPAFFPGGFDGCWAATLEICVFPAGASDRRDGFIAALSGDIDGKNESGGWLEEDAVFIGFGKIAPYYPPELELGVPQVYHDDFLN